MIADYEVSDDCINHYSYGEICIHCGCCATNNPNYKSRLISRLKYYQEYLNDELNFIYDDDPTWRAIQKENIGYNIKYLKREIRMIKKILKTMR